MNEFKKFNWSLFLTVCLHSFLATWTGYMFTVLTSLEPYVKNLTVSSIYDHYSHTLTQSQWSWAWSIINCSLPIGCLIGSPLLKPITDNYGRRNSVMIIKNIVFLIALTMQFAARPLNTVELLVMGRFLTGLSQPLAGFVPAFIGECAPTDKRGMASMLVGVGFRLYIVLGTVMTLPQIFGTESLWHYAFILPFIPSVLHLMATPMVPKSPKYVFIVEKNVKESMKSIEFYHGKAVDSGKVLAEYAKEALLASHNKHISFRVYY